MSEYAIEPSGVAALDCNCNRGGAAAPPLCSAPKDLTSAMTHAYNARAVAAIEEAVFACYVVGVAM